MSDLIDKVKAFYAAFSKGDPTTIVAGLADDVVWEFEGPSEIQATGIRRSPKEVGDFFVALASQGADHNLDMTEFVASNDAVAAFGRYQGTIRTTGLKVDTPLAHYFKFRNGKVVRFIQLSNTAATLDAIRGHKASTTSG